MIWPRGCETQERGDGLRDLGTWSTSKMSKIKCILKYLSYTYNLSMFLANLRLGCYSLFSNPQNQLCLTSLPRLPTPQPNITTTTTPPPPPHKFCVRYCFQMPSSKTPDRRLPRKQLKGKSKFLHRYINDWN